MYEDFFGLNRSPFELSPDPSFLFSSENTKDALASMLHAIRRRKGFVVLTGEVGTGKTLMLRCLFESLKQQQIPFAYFIGPRLSTIDFLSYVAFDLGIKVPEPSKGKLLLALYEFLLGQFEKGLTTVLVIDEAHQISRDVLEEIRLLTNFETVQQKLVQILLVGQPELDKTLDSVELRPLKQRIAVRCQMEPFNPDETSHYIETRLKIAGTNSRADTIFPAETIKAIYHYSIGIPRLVNVLCEQALIAAYARQVHVVSVQMVEEVACHFHLQAATDLKQKEVLAEQADESFSVMPLEAVPALSEATIRAVEPNEPPSAQSNLPSKPETCSLISTNSRDNTHPVASTRGVSQGPTVQTDGPDLAAALPDRNRESDLPSALPVSWQFASWIPESQVRDRSISGTKFTSTLTGLSAERNRLSGLTGKHINSHTELQEAFGAGLGYPEQSHKLKLVAAVILAFAFVGYGVFWLQSGTTGNAAARNSPVMASPIAMGGGEIVAPRIAQATQNSNPVPEERPTRQSVPIVLGDVSEPSGREQEEPRAPANESLLDMQSDLPTLKVQQKGAQESHTVPGPELQSIASNDDTIRTELSSSSSLDAPAPTDIAPQRLIDALSTDHVLSSAAPSQLQAAATSKFQPAMLINRVDPTHAPTSGTVQVKATIGIDGVPRQLTSVRGEALLVQAAMEAIKHWRYQPAMLDGRPIESQAMIEMTFVSSLKRE